MVQFLNPKALSLNFLHRVFLSEYSEYDDKHPANHSQPDYDQRYHPEVIHNVTALIPHCLKIPSHLTGLIEPLVIPLHKHFADVPLDLILGYEVELGELDECLEHEEDVGGERDGHERDVDEDLQRVHQHPHLLQGDTQEQGQDQIRRDCTRHCLTRRFYYGLKEQGPV